MDFHVLPRRELQALCKKNRIPANMTNLAMADALQAMDTVEGIGEIQESLQFLSPKKADLISPSLPRTARRTSSCRAGPTQDELKERQGSPLPRSRRVTAKASEIMKMIDEPEEEKEEVKEGSMKEAAKTPKAPNTRRRVSKKEEGIETPAPRAVTTRRRATKKEEKEGEKEEVEKEEKTVGVMTRRRTRQSSRKEAEEVTVGLRRSTRASVMKMGVLAGEEEDGEGKDEAGDSSSNQISEVSMAEQNNSFDLISGKKFEEPLMEDEVKIPAETKEEEKVDNDEEKQEEKEGKDGEQDPASESTAAIQGGLGSNEIQEDESSATEQEMPLEEAEKKQEEDPIDAVPGFEGSPIGGLIEDQQQTLFAEIMTDEQKGEMSEGVDLDVNLQNPTAFTDEISKETEDCIDGGIASDETVDQSDKIPAAGDQISFATAAPEVTESDDGCEELIKKVEEMSLKLPENLPECCSGEATDFSDAIPIAASEIAAVAVISAEIDGSRVSITEIHAEMVESGNVAGEILAEVEQSCNADGSGDLVGEIHEETKKSSDDHHFGDLTCEIHKEIKESGDLSCKNKSNDDFTIQIPVKTTEDGLTFSPLAGEIAVEAIESSEISNSPRDSVIVSSTASSSPLRSLIEDRIVSEVSVNGAQGLENGRSVGIYTEESNDKENSRDLSLTTLTALGPTAEELKAKERLDFNGLSLRKLKSLYREKVVEEKRAALKALDENCL